MKKNSLRDLAQRCDRLCCKASDAFCGHTGWTVPVMALAVLVLAVVARVGAFGQESGDVTYFLRPWYTKFYENGFSALGESFGDYTPAYMFLLYCLSLFRFAPDSFAFLAGLKTVSLLFDVGCAVAAYCILRRLGGKRETAILGGGLLLFLPTVFLNSAYWGQCDSIYCFFLLFSLYFALGEKHSLAWLFWGFSFSFKLQAVFFLPFLIYLCLDRRLKLRWAVLVPVGYLAPYLPALIAGRSFGEILTVYAGQTAGSYVQLSLNAPSLYMLFAKVFLDYPAMTAYAICFCAFAVGGLLVWLFRKKPRLSSRELLIPALLFSILVPFLLPRMHERYYFLGDLLGCVYLFGGEKRRYLGLLPGGASLLAYIPYLFPGKLDREWLMFLGALMLLVAILLLIDLLCRIPSREEKPTSEAPSREEDVCP